MGRLINFEVAKAVMFLAASSSSYINGHTLVVDDRSLVRRSPKKRDSTVCRAQQIDGGEDIRIE
ncbi:hypothetical protein GQ43DRAFT_439940 [Delitschia confertaspora ATCC 74209]|uniref:Uncharacterized protein n=1 Tax=Delitschia confertaspora ATCC 74209 TaxID=1513339 RepID=A0A9P4JN51_9PLEO|nr:hypothetical protein GQ43DRAFT_439940 [Delitschia confertaspora ATCC 74209]